MELISHEEYNRNLAFNYNAQKINYKCQNIWTSKMKHLLRDYPEYATNFSYIYYNQNEMPSIKEFIQYIESPKISVDIQTDPIEESELKYTNDSLVKENDSLVKENDSLVKENDSLVKENVSLVKENDSLVKENCELKEKNAKHWIIKDENIKLMERVSELNLVNEKLIKS